MNRSGPDQLGILLKKTARSFTLSVKLFPASLRAPVTVGYLLCRTADTVADRPNFSLLAKKTCLENFRSVFSRFPVLDEDLNALLSSLSNDGEPKNKKDSREPTAPLPAGEAALLNNFPALANAFLALDRTDRALVQAVVESIVKGMLLDLEVFGDGKAGVHAFQTNTQLEGYLHFIGGEPGRFLAALTLERTPSLSKDDKGRIIDEAIAFGKGLQMVNILRDIPRDLLNGRCYLPEETLSETKLTPNDLKNPAAAKMLLPLFHRLLDETAVRLSAGETYLRLLPKKLVRMRAAAYVPLVLGLKTLGALRQTENILDPAVTVKIPRSAVRRSLETAIFDLFSNRLLHWHIQKLTRAADETFLK